MKLFNGIIMVGTAALLAACSSGSGGGTGTLSLDITDAPVDEAHRVVVEFTGVEIQPRDGKRLVFDFEEGARHIDLLALAGGDTEPLLEEVELKAGAYNFILLKVNAERQELDSFIEFDGGATHSLYVPSGAQQGLRLVSGFTILVGGEHNFTIDFDLRKSVHLPGGPTPVEEGEDVLDDYFLRPALRLVDNAEAGQLAGSVTGECLDNDNATPATPAIYVYAGDVTKPNDLCTECENGDRPLTTTFATYNDSEQQWEYTVSFLAAGDYTAALTCEAADDNPEVNDEITFSAPQSVTITAGETAEVNFTI